MQTVKLFSTFILLCGLAFGTVLCLNTMAFPSAFNNAFSVYHIMGQLFSGAFIGLSIGLPAFIVSSALSWMQLFLLTVGAIDPHLASEGFIESIRTILIKFWSINH